MSKQGFWQLAQDKINANGTGCGLALNKLDGHFAKPFMVLSAYLEA